MDMKYGSFAAVVFVMALMFAQGCAISDEEFADELQAVETEQAVAGEGSPTIDELAATEEAVAAEAAMATDESVAAEQFEEDEVLECFEFAEPCYPNGFNVKHQCGVRCCNGTLGQAMLYCGQCWPFSNWYCSTTGSSPKRIRWSP
jgi:hypothetical protein